MEPSCLAAGRQTFDCDCEVAEGPNLNNRSTLRLKGGEFQEIQNCRSSPDVSLMELKSDCLPATVIRPETGRLLNGWIQEGWRELLVATVLMETNDKRQDGTQLVVASQLELGYIPQEGAELVVASQQVVRDTHEATELVVASQQELRDYAQAELVESSQKELNDESQVGTSQQELRDGSRSCHRCPRKHQASVAAVLLLCFVIGAAAGNVSDVPLSLTPPRGWNSYDSFSWIISEEEFLQNAKYVADNLLRYGYEYVVVDFLWYRKLEPGASVWSSGHDIIDEWGRPMPDPTRWPSTRGGKGFKPIADKVHAMGLKFGIHVMRGINTEAVAQNTPIFCDKDCPKDFEERNWTAKDITVPGGQCSWMPNCFTSVDTSCEGGVAFINSLYQQYAEWEVDMIKNDCVFGVYDLNVPEVTTVAKAIERTGRPILYSLSPGVSATPELGKQVAHLSHMYRVTSDDWDSWADVRTHFSVARDFAAAGLIGAPGLSGGKSWPDMDMLPIGWLTDPGAAYGPWRSTSLTKDEQMTQITLWAIVKSPLMFGGDLRHIDQWTLDLITQPILLEINANSTHNRELSSSEQSHEPVIALADCGMANTSQWKLERTENGQDEICWSWGSKRGLSWGRRQAPSSDCLSSNDTFLPVPDLRTPPSWKEHGVKLGLIRSSTTEAVCLNSNSILNDTAGKDALFSPCDGRASQVWHLIDGNLVSHVDGRCAVVQEPSDQWKVWVARGSEGQSYVAFFNLGSTKTEISVPVDNIMNLVSVTALTNANSSVNQPGSDVSGSLLRKSQWACAGKDVWNNSHFIANVTDLKASVEIHGTVLYELHCSPGKRSDYFSSLTWFSIVVCVLVICLLGNYYFAARSPLSGYWPLADLAGPAVYAKA